MLSDVPVAIAGHGAAGQREQRAVSPALVGQDRGTSPRDSVIYVRRSVSAARKRSTTAGKVLAASYARAVSLSLTIPAKRHEASLFGHIPQIYAAVHTPTEDAQVDRHQQKAGA